MRLIRIIIGLALMLFCCLQVAPQSQRLTVKGKLVRSMAIGGETTGWVIELESQISVDEKQINSIEVSYKETTTLEKLENRRVKASGKLTHRHGVETGDRAVLEVSAIKETKP